MPSSVITLTKVGGKTIFDHTGTGQHRSISNTARVSIEEGGNVNNIVILDADIVYTFRFGEVDKEACNPQITLAGGATNKQWVDELTNKFFSV